MNPLSQSFTYTATVMCMAETSTMPSFTPLFFTAAATSSVMRMNSWRFLVLNQRYSVSVFIASQIQPRRHEEIEAHEESLAWFSSWFFDFLRLFVVSCERQRSVCAQIPSSDDAGAEVSQPGGRNHRSVVCRELDAGDEDRQFARFAALAAVGAKPAIGRNPAGDPHAAGAVPPCRVEQRIEERLHDDTLEAGTNVIDLCVGQRLNVAQAQWATPLRHVTQHRCFQTAETEITCARHVGRIPIGVSNPGLRKRNRSIVPPRRSPIDDRP